MNPALGQKWYGAFPEAAGGFGSTGENVIVLDSPVGKVIVFYQFARQPAAMDGGR